VIKMHLDEKRAQKISSGEMKVRQVCM
jgi:hypothetical protein